MISDVVTALSTSVPQDRAMAQIAAQGGAASVSQPKLDFDYTVSSIRVDLDADLAILEFRSVKTGDVLRQYPTEKQIAGYQRAAQLETNKESRQQIVSNMGGGNNSVAVNNITPQASAPVQQNNVAMAASTSAPSPAGSSAASNPSAGPGNVNVNAGLAAQMSDSSSVSQAQVSGQSITV